MAKAGVPSFSERIIPITFASVNSLRASNVSTSVTDPNPLITSHEVNMYSQSNSFLGGGYTGRPGPGPTQYGQQQSFSGFQQPQQQSNSFQPQPTGFGGGPVQPQATGFPGYGQQSNFQAPQQQPAFTGYPPQNQAPPEQSYQPPEPQPQSQSQPQSQQRLAQPIAAPLRPQQTSSQIAQSFQSSGPPPPTPPKNDKSRKIPNIRLSFITATDQAKFEQLFKSAVGDSQALDGELYNPRNEVMLTAILGEKAKDLLLRSNLPGSALSQIW